MDTTQKIVLACMAVLIVALFGAYLAVLSDAVRQGDQRRAAYAKMPPISFAHAAAGITASR